MNAILRIHQTRAHSAAVRRKRRCNASKEQIKYTFTK